MFQPNFSSSRNAIHAGESFLWSPNVFSGIAADRRSAVADILALSACWRFSRRTDAAARLDVATFGALSPAASQ